MKPTPKRTESWHGIPIGATHKERTFALVVAFIVAVLLLLAVAS